MNSLSSVRSLVSTRSLGIEIEVMIDRAVGRAVRGEYTGFFYGTSDMSIMPSYNKIGVEFISQPLPKNWLIKEINRLASKVGAWETNSSCGIHVHVNREWLNKDRAKAIYKFYQSLSDAQREHFFGRASNSYCDTDTWDSSRYNAINNKNVKTIEFRMFNSGNAAWAIYCVKMVCYLIHNAKHLNIGATRAFVEINRPN